MISAVALRRCVNCRKFCRSLKAWNNILYSWGKKKTKKKRGGLSRKTFWDRLFLRLARVSRLCLLSNNTVWIIFSLNRSSTGDCRIAANLGLQVMLYKRSSTFRGLLHCGWFYIRFLLWHLYSFLVFFIFTCPVVFTYWLTNDVNVSRIFAKSEKHNNR